MRERERERERERGTFDSRHQKQTCSDNLNKFITNTMLIGFKRD